LVEGVPTALTNHPVANAIRRGALGVEIEGLESVVFEADYSSATMVYPARKKAVRVQVVGRFQRAFLEFDGTGAWPEFGTFELIEPSPAFKYEIRDKSRPDHQSHRPFM
jgi:hypothetical protein